MPREEFPPPSHVLNPFSHPTQRQNPSPAIRDLERRNSRQSQHNPYDIRSPSRTTAQVSRTGASGSACARAEGTATSSSSEGTRWYRDDDTGGSSHHAYGPAINMDIAGNTFIGVNYGHVTQSAEFHVLRSLPVHPDISGRLSDYFPSSRDADEAHILQWIDSTISPELVLCVLGKAGVGKSTLAKHLAMRLRRDNQLAAEIFFGFALPDWSPESVIRMIAGQLCGTYPALMQAVSNAIRLDVGPSVSLETRIHNFILEPIQSLHLDRPLVILLDAMDQWAPHPVLFKALSCLNTETHLIRFIVLGRPGLEDHFQSVSIRPYNLPDVSKSVMRDYFGERLDGVRWEYGRKPTPQTIHQLVSKADGLFIWSSTLCSLLEDKLSCPKPHDTIAAVLQSQRSMGDNESLANLYHDAINLRFPKPDHKAKLKVFLGGVLVLQEPLPIATFASLTSMDIAVVRQIQADLGPLQTGKAEDIQDMVYPASSTFHLSLLEYLQSPDTPFHLAFTIDTFHAHSQLGKVCLEELCRIPSSQAPHAPFVPPLRTYAMRYWPMHIAHGTPTVSPASDAEWRATPHSLILNSLSIPQWQHWASTYLHHMCTSTVPDSSNQCIPQHVVSQVVKSLLDAQVTAGLSDAAVAMAEVAVRLQHQSSDAWLRLGKAYNNAAKDNVSIHLVEIAVLACRHAADLAGEGDYVAHQELASALWLRFSRLGSLVDLNKAILLERAALLLTPAGHAGRATSLNNLAESLISHFKQTGTIDSLDEAIVLHREALLLEPPGHTGRSISLNNLAESLISHFEQTGTIDSLDEAIVLHREALLLEPPGHTGRSISLDNLAKSLMSHFKQTGTIVSLDEAIVLHREALSLRPPGHPDRSNSLNNLAHSLHSHSKLTGTIGSLDEAIVLHREALSLEPPGHPDRSNSLNNLASALHSHFKQTGTIGSLDEAIVLHREALSLRPPGHPGRSNSLGNLAHSLHSHFKLTGTIGSLDEAIVLHREALSLRPPGHPNRPNSLNNLADALDSHFDLTGTIDSLDEAIVLYREALLLRLLGHPDRSNSLYNLAGSLASHFDRTGSIDSLNEAIMLHREALSLRPPGHPKRSDSLHNLALSLDSHFRLTGTTDSLDEEIALLRESLSLCPPGHQDHKLALECLADSLQASYRLTGNVQTRDEALALLAQATQTMQ